MATRSEAKLAVWSASKKDDNARKELVSFLAENSTDGPGGYVPDDAVESEVRRLTKPAPKKAEPKRGRRKN